MLKRVSLKITGRVQGVGFRYYSRQEAIRRELRGYVANLPDGSVEIIAEGEEKALKKFVRWCYNGDGSASVYSVKQSWSEPTGSFSSFVIKS